jgi:RNA polymerase sigma-70 factor, ECF subfamily
MSDELEKLKSGNEDAVAEVFSVYRDKLQRMIRFRLDRRLYGRVDTTDVLQDVWLESARRIQDYTNNPVVPFFVWLRQLAFQIIIDLHRRHLGAQKRNVSQEISLGQDRCDTSISIAAHLVGDLTSPSQAVMREERMGQLREALNNMDEIDREVLALRHFEELSNNEVAEVLGIRKTAASNRYVRALKRLKEVLESFSGFSSTTDS